MFGDDLKPSWLHVVNPYNATRRSIPVVGIIHGLLSPVKVVSPLESPAWLDTGQAGHHVQSVAKPNMTKRHNFMLGFRCWDLSKLGDILPVFDRKEVLSHMVCLPIVVLSSRLRLYVHLTSIIVNTVQLYCVRVHHIAMILTYGNPEVVLPIVSTVTHRSSQTKGLSFSPSIDVSSFSGNPPHCTPL